MKYKVTSKRSQAGQYYVYVNGMLVGEIARMHTGEMWVWSIQSWESEGWVTEAMENTKRDALRWFTDFTSDADWDRYFAEHWE